MFEVIILFQIKEKDIDVTLRSNLIEVNADRREAIFQNLDKPEELVSLKRTNYPNYTWVNLSKLFFLRKQKNFPFLDYKLGRCKKLFLFIKNIQANSSKNWKTNKLFFL